MATKPTDAVNRIAAANGNAYDPINNPGGLAQGGHRQNFVPDLQATVSVAQWSSDSAGESAASATATAADRVQTGQDRTAAAQSASDANTSATNAANSAQQAAASAASVNLPPTSTANAGKPLRVKADGTGYETTTLSLSGGGTGATNGTEARQNLGAFGTSGGTFTGGVAMTPTALGASSGTVVANYLTGNIKTGTINGALSIQHSNIPIDGGDLEIHLTYASGTLSFTNPIRWKLGGGAESFSLVDTGVVFTTNVNYTIILWRTGGATYGVVT